MIALEILALLGALYVGGLFIVLWIGIIALVLDRVGHWTVEKLNNRFGGQYE